MTSKNPPKRKRDEEENTSKKTKNPRHIEEEVNFIKLAQKYPEFSK